MPPGVSSTKAPEASKWPTKPSFAVGAPLVQETYGVFPKNVMSGVPASSVGAETGLPPLNSSKWSPLTSRETKIAWCPPTSSEKTTHGAVVPPGVSVPVATRGSSASFDPTRFREQASSAATDAAHGPKPLAPVVSSVFVWPAVPLPTACHSNPPSAAGLLTILAAKTCSLLRSPMALGSFSYQTVHATVSLGPVNAMSGSTPLRLASTFSDGSPAADEPPSFARRSRPTCCQQNWLTLAAADGLKPVHGAFGAACLTPLETKIWSWLPEPATLPSCSCHATHGTGSAPATAAPPATDGFSASLSVLMFSDGTPAPRSWPSGCHVFAAARKRLAKICFWPPRAALGSYQASHGTVRPAPAKSIDGASASTLRSMFSDGPCVTHCPFLKARTKICCELPV